MKKTALIYSVNSKNTSQVAQQILDHLKDVKLEIINAETLTEEQFLAYDNYILGVSTWFDGELPNYWDEFGPAMEDLNLKQKNFAIFGLGDQVNYPENFVDAVGILAGMIENSGGKIVGLTSSKEYKFEHSKALRDEKLLGLAIDTKNQSPLTIPRITKWIEQLKKEFS